jgi:hypothetical protein
MRRLNHDAMMAMALSEPDIPFDVISSKQEVPKQLQLPTIPEPSVTVSNRREHLEAIEKIVAFFVCGGKGSLGLHISEATATTIIDTPMPSDYDVNNPLLKTLRELINEAST